MTSMTTCQRWDSVTGKIQRSCKRLALHHGEAPPQVSGVSLLNHSTTQIKTGPNDHHGKTIGVQIPLDLARFQPQDHLIPNSFRFSQVPAPGHSVAHLPQIIITHRHRDTAGRSWPSVTLPGVPGCAVLASESHKLGSPWVSLCAWCLGIQLAELFPFLSHAPRWEMIHENQEGKISPKAAE